MVLLAQWRCIWWKNMAIFLTCWCSRAEAKHIESVTSVEQNVSKASSNMSLPQALPSTSSNSAGDEVTLRAVMRKLSNDMECLSDDAATNFREDASDATSGVVPAQMVLRKHLHKIRKSMVTMQDMFNTLQEVGGAHTKQTNEPPTNDDYGKFLDVENFYQDLHEIVRIGEQVHASLNNDRWLEERQMNWMLRKFLHNPTRAGDLRKKMAHSQYADQRLHGMRIAIVGAGLGGLRFAVEAALNGATVHVMEKRNTFSSYNALKVWPHSSYDIESLGGRVLFPKLFRYTTRRIPIAVMEQILLRVALVLGVRVHFECEITGLHPDDFQPVTKRGCLTSLRFRDVEFDAVFDGTGRSGILRDSHLRVESEAEPLIPVMREMREILGITMNFHLYDKASGQENWERDFAENSKVEARYNMYNPALQEELEISNGGSLQTLFNNKSVELGNLVYLKGAPGSSHYVLITVNRNVLVKHRVVDREHATLPTPDFLEKIDTQQLAKLGLKIADEWNIPHDRSKGIDAFLPTPTGRPDISLFDLGPKAKALATSRSFKRHDGKHVYFGLLGDALETPFWPEGTGGNHALYAAHVQTLCLVKWRVLGKDVKEDDIFGYGSTMIGRFFANWGYQGMLQQQEDGMRAPEKTRTEYENLVRQMYGDALTVTH